MPCGPCGPCGCGRPGFGGRTTGRPCAPARRAWMWSPRFRGADDRVNGLAACAAADVVAPVSGGGRQNVAGMDEHVGGCGRPGFGGRTTGGRRRGRRRTRCGRPGFGGRTTGSAGRRAAPPGCGRPGLGGGRQVTLHERVDMYRCSHFENRARTMSGMAARIVGAVPWKPAGRTAPNTASGRGTGSTAAGGRTFDDAVDFK